MNTCFEKKIHCVEVIIDQDGSLSFQQLLLSKKGKVIRIISKSEGRMTLEQLTLIIKPPVAAVLVLSGKGVLIREAQSLKSDESRNKEQDMVRHIFPDAHPDELSINQYRVDENKIILSLARSESIIRVAELFAKYGIIVVDVFIGPLVVNTILMLFDTLPQRILTELYSIDLNQDKISHISINKQNESSTYNVGGLQVKSQCLCSFAAGFAYLVINLEQASSSIQKIKENSNFIRFSNTLKKALSISVGILFLILLVNYFILDYYTKKNNELRSVVQQAAGLVNRTDSLQNLIHQREAFFQELSSGSELRNSFLIDRFCSTTASGIKLKELVLYPIRFKSDDRTEEPRYSPKIIEAYVFVNQSNQLNDWIKRIESEPWISSVEFSNFKEQEDHTSFVKLLIRLK